MHTTLAQDISMLLKSPDAKVDEYIDLVRKAEPLACDRERNFLLGVIQRSFPRALDLVAPKRAAAAFAAIDSIVGSVRRRLSLADNSLPDQTRAGFGMTNPIPSGLHGGLALQMFVQVGFKYRNREGYAASLEVQQESPEEPIEYVVGYHYPKKGKAPLILREGLRQPGGALLPAPDVVVGLFEHLFGRVIHAQDLDDSSGPGVFYR